jgi:hypothetical protein
MIEVTTMLDLRAALQNQPPAEHEYDWAPIHMPGSVQSYGVLLVVEPRSRRVQFVSENCTDMLGLKPADILDKPYPNLCDDEQERKFLKERIAAETILFPNPIRLTIQGRAFDAVFHNEGDTHLIEIEPAGGENVSYAELSLKTTAELYDPPTVEDLQQRAVRMIRDVTGFDRVMLYRFDSRYNGQVIARGSAPSSACSFPQAISARGRARCICRTSPAIFPISRHPRMVWPAYFPAAAMPRAVIRSIWGVPICAAWCPATSPICAISACRPRCRSASMWMAGSGACLPATITSHAWSPMKSAWCANKWR